ncbi:tyrosine--tRNA ligase [Methylocapsa palsarum]|uniref:Tyrosine--tRNA ligase n=1 Tax=Methylocapsa palsarum TaxID=1612308 RepID=A0A1I4AG59_9HYPH|nr:tyrosine--tRNA ligase [Methylocapsa palsarum]SFK54719.1 tyrosyl-tRNA synthetase [Methylocapsa palsarum]
MSDDFQPQSEFLRVLIERGFVHQCSDFAGLDALAKAGGLTAYIGFDCTAPSLHVGSLVQIMLLRWLQKTGGRPIALMGGGTTRVGDPSGKDESRKLISLETIEANKQGIKRIFSKFLDFGEDAPSSCACAAIMQDNSEWLGALNYIDFLREIGRHFSVNRMLAMDSVKMRLERDQELSFLEFNYMCLQAYDFVELHKRQSCVLQMGGSDQWGNIITGLDLGRRLGTGQLYALTSPLLTTASGAKMGKTAQGAVWLDAGMLPVFDYWQYWRNCEDRDVGRFLKLFTELPLEDIARLEALGGAEINEAKKVLATEATAMVHGRAAASSASEAARQTFEEGALAEDLPFVEIPRGDIEAGLGALAAFVRAGLVASTGEARRQVKGGGLRINDQTLTDERAMIGAGDLNEGSVKLSLGKKRHVLLRAV